jgi:hypothetical protein
MLPYESFLQISPSFFEMLHQLSHDFNVNLICKLSKHFNQRLHLEQCRLEKAKISNDKFAIEDVSTSIKMLEHDWNMMLLSSHNSNELCQRIDKYVAQNYDFKF